MKDYYIAPIKKITITNPTTSDGFYYTYDKKIEELEEKIFYFNIFNVLIEAETKFPMFRDSELDDLIQENINSNSKKNEFSLVYVDTQELKYIKSESTTSKMLKKIKR